MHGRRLDHSGRDLGRVAFGHAQLDGVGVELAGEQDLADDVRQAERLGLDHLEEGGSVCFRELDVLAAQSAHGSVDRRERRA